MAGLGFQRKRILSSCFVSLVMFCISQFSIALVPMFLPWLSLLGMLPVSGLVLVVSLCLGRFLRRLLGISQSAPVMVVFHLLFLWGVYVVVIHQAVPSLMDVIINAECALLLFGLYRILSGDPGIVAYASSSSALSDCNGLSESNIFENSSSLSRVRYCKICKTGVRGFDHHCSAFGNCIGQKNQCLFIMLLVGFIIAEAFYTISSTQYIAKSLSTDKIGFENNVTGNVVISTLLFTVLQLLWQVIFLIWNIYCICTGIKTEEWINWKKYPEFHQPGDSSEIRFSNPYDKGIINNIKDFINPMEYSLHVINVLS